MNDDNIILDVNNLKVRFFYEEGTVKAANGVSYRLKEGSSIGIVGESGCGKTVSTYAILNILSSAGKIVEGSIEYTLKNGTVVDLSKLKAESEEIRSIRGKEISMIFQEPMTAFSPVHTIYSQILEGVMLHQDLTKEKAREQIIDLMEKVGIPDPDKRVDDYPFQFSGGMRQRAMIAMALACNPRVLIADEPTTALDVTIQAQVLQLIKEMQEDMNLSLILITHDLGVIAHMVEEVYIMYLGRVVESGPVQEIFYNPKHPYTRDLLNSIPNIKGNKGKISSIEGSVPDSYSLPPGCSFHTRCSDYLGKICSTKVPASTEINKKHCVFCHKYSEGKVTVDE